MEELENGLIDVLNASQLPLEAKRYVLRHVFDIVDHEYQKLLLMMPKTEVKEAKTE